MTSLAISDNPFETSQPVNIAPGTTIRAYLDSQDIQGFYNPTVCKINNEYYGEDEWPTYVLKIDDRVEFISRLGGGGDSDILATVLAIAVMIIAPQVAGAYFAAGSTAFAITEGLIIMGGNLLISALTRPPERSLPPKTQEHDPIYGLDAQGNLPAIGQALPLWWGYMPPHYPYYASQPYFVFVGNKYRLRQTFVLSDGKVVPDFVGIEDTPLSSYSNSTYKVIHPGEPADLYDDCMFSVKEVKNLEVYAPNDDDYDNEKSGWIGGETGFVLNGSGTLIDKLLLHRSAAGYRVNDDQSLTNLTIEWEEQLVKIDDAGAKIGDWFAVSVIIQFSGTTTQPKHYSIVGSNEVQDFIDLRHDVVSNISVVVTTSSWKPYPSITYTPDPADVSVVNGVVRISNIPSPRYAVRVTYDYVTTQPVLNGSFTGNGNEEKHWTDEVILPPGRYAYRIRRTNDLHADAGSRAVHKLSLLGINTRSYLSFVNNDCTLVQTEIEGSAQLSATAQQNIKIGGMRYNNQDQVDESIVGLVKHIIRMNADTDAEALSRYDLTSFDQCDSSLITEGTTVGYLIKDVKTMAEQINRVIKCGRMISVLDRGQVVLVRDQQQSIEKFFITENISQAGGLTPVFPGKSTASKALVTYRDKNTGRVQAKHEVVPNFAVGDNWVDINVEGLGDKSQIDKYVTYVLANNHYRRLFFKRTMRPNKAIKIGSMGRLTEKWKDENVATGRITSFVLATLLMGCNADLSKLDNSLDYQITIIDKYGVPEESIPVTLQADGYLLLEHAPTTDIDLVGDANNPRIVLEQMGSIEGRVICLGISDADNGLFEYSFCNYHDATYTSYTPDPYIDPFDYPHVG